MSISYLLLVLQVFTVALIYYAVKYRYLHALRVYPGPFWASLSNVWKFYHYLRGDLHLVERDLHQKYGPIVRTGPTTLSFASPAAFDSIYGVNPSFEKGDFYGFARQPMTGEYNIFSARTHLEHRERRKAVGAAFLALHDQALAPIVTRHVQHFLSKLDTAWAQMEDGIINVADHVQAMTLNTLLEIIYSPALVPPGQPWTETIGGERILSDLRLASKFGWGVAHIPLLASFGSFKPIHKMLRKPTLNAAGTPISISAISARTKHLLLQAPELVTGVDQPSIAKSMLLVEKGDAKYLEPTDIYNECFNLLFMGPGSTTAAIIGCLERLGSEEGLAWQERVRNDHHQIGEPSKSEVLRAVVRESLRYSTPFPTAFPREVQPGAEKAIAGVQEPLPVETIVGANSWLINHDKRLWGRDALQWKPERWLDAGNDANMKTLNDRCVVFGKGTRSCIGKDIALSIIMQVVAGFVAKWRFEQASEVKSSAWLEMQIEWCGLKLAKV